MPRQADTPCADCGTLLWSSSTSLPPGERVCQPCRRARPTYRSPEPAPTGTVVCLTCGRPFDQRRADQRYCDRLCRAKRTGFAASKATSKARGYGAEHRRTRKRLLVELAEVGIGRCCIGGEPIYPGDDLHLDHTPDRTGYRGLACAAHNRRDGARRGRLAQMQSKVGFTRADW